MFRRDVTLRTRSMFKKYSRGFTLIELMIVVAVIGILSSIAIPQYQNYIRKSQLGSALATLSALKVSVEDYITSSGAFPDVTSSALADTLGANESTLGSMEAKAASSGTYAGQLILHFADNTLLKGKKLSLERNENGGWRCITDISGAAYIPQQCSSETPDTEQ